MTWIGLNKKWTIIRITVIYRSCSNPHDNPATNLELESTNGANTMGSSNCATSDTNLEGQNSLKRDE